MKTIIYYKLVYIILEREFWASDLIKFSFSIRHVLTLLISAQRIQQGREVNYFVVLEISNLIGINASLVPFRSALLNNYSNIPRRYPHYRLRYSVLV